ncbi:MAG: hypothetical protein M3O91_05935 [Chloroflexota bacterium]|nr:hypothetical protein [Chloroflexota bacterium]
MADAPLAREVHAAGKRAEQANKYPPSPPLAEAAQATVAFRAKGRSIGAGQLVPIDDPLVRQFPANLQGPARPIEVTK